MNKLNFLVYPAVVILSLGAAFSAHAQSSLDPTDSAAYGPTYSVTAPAAAPAAKPAQVVVVQGSKYQSQALATPYVDLADQAAYGPTQVGTSTLTRAAVRAEFLAFRANNKQIIDVETGESITIGSTVRADASRVLAGYSGNSGNSAQ